ncbi:S53 family peptidase [Flexivirga sp. B27]
MKRRHVATGAVALTTAIAMAGAGATMAHAAGPGNDSVRLSNSGALSHSGARTLGAASSATKVDLSIAVPLRNQALMQSMLAKGTVISPAQYKKLFGASPASLAKVSKWAKSQGMKVVSSDAASGTVNVQAPVSHVNKAFSLKMQRVAIGSRTGLAPNNDPQLPRELGVTSIVGLNTVSTLRTGPVNKLRSLKSANSGKSGMQSQRSGVRTGGSLGKAAPAATGSSDCSSYWGENVLPTAKVFPNESNFMCGYSPQEAVKLYNAGKASTAKSNIGILLWCNDPQAKAKVNDLSNKFDYPTLGSYDDQSAPEDPGTCSDGAAYGEQNMDIQTSHIMSPKASISYYGASSNSFDDLLSMFQKAVKQHKVSTLSMSFSAPESQTPKSFIDQFERTATQASMTGISVFASSGDMGDESIPDGGTTPVNAKDVAYPASSPNVTAVGGTAVGTKQDGSRMFTVGWSTTWWAQPDESSTEVSRYPFPHNAVGAGGGVSGKFAQPAWQKGKVTGSTTKRTLPDVSAVADVMTPIALEFNLGEVSGSGGTSQSSPLVASLVASSKALTGRQIGNAAPYFYKLGASDIMDVKPVKAGTYGGPITRADNGDLVLEGLAQPADSLRVTSGWDNVTGVGEPTGNFLTNFGK